MRAGRLSESHRQHGKLRQHSLPQLFPGKTKCPAMKADFWFWSIVHLKGQPHTAAREQYKFHLEYES